MTSKFVEDLAQKLDQLKPALNRRRLFEELIQKALTEASFTDDGMSQVFVVVDKTTNAPFIVQPLVSLAVFGAENVADEFAQKQSGAVTVRASLTSPADVEQLSELRKVAEAARTWFHWYVGPRIEDAPVSSLTVLQMIEAALNPKQPEKETQ